MKKFGEIPCELLSKEQSVQLRLKEQPYIIIIPKSLINKIGINQESFTFILLENENKISLVGPIISQTPTTKQSSGEIIHG